MNTVTKISEDLTDLEYYLQESYEINKQLELEKELENQKKENSFTQYQRADKGASFDDFIDMVRNIVTKTMKKLQVEFIPDDGLRLSMVPPEELDHPVIYYKLISRIPRKNEPKPIFREPIIEKDENNKNVRTGDIYGQIFDCELQFNILASDYSMANKVMDTFEYIMFTYSGYFKQNGVSQIFFVKQFTDETMDIYRQKVSVRSLVYRVSLEKIWLNYDATITEINKLRYNGGS